MALNHMKTNKQAVLRATILELLKTRSHGGSICPSEAARAVFNENWREQMSLIREVAREMVTRGEIEICQKGLVVDPAVAKGPIRLRMSQDSAK